MGSIIKLNTGNYQARYLPMELETGIVKAPSRPDYMGVTLACFYATKLTGKDDVDTPTNLLKVGGYYKLDFGTTKPGYHGVVSINPKLLERAICQTQSVLNPDTQTELSLFIQPLKQVDLKDFDFHIQINLID